MKKSNRRTNKQKKNPTIKKKKGKIREITIVVCMRHGIQVKNIFDNLKSIKANVY